MASYLRPVSKRAVADYYAYRARVRESAKLQRARARMAYAIEAPVGPYCPLRAKVRVVCNECGKRWSVSATTATGPQCSRCNSVDVEVA